MRSLFPRPGLGRSPAVTVELTRPIGGYWAAPSALAVVADDHVLAVVDDGRLTLDGKPERPVGTVGRKSTTWSSAGSLT
jgi:hypothetical protein